MTRTIWFSPSGIREREFERKPHAILVKLDTVDQRRQRVILLRLQTRTPGCGRLEKRSEPARVERSLFNCSNHRLLIIENASGRSRDAAFDLGGRQAPAAIHTSGGSFHQTARDIVAITAGTFHCVARRQAPPFSSKSLPISTHDFALEFR